MTKHEIMLAENSGDLWARHILEADPQPWYIPVPTRIYLLTRFGFSCKICGMITDTPEIDHIMPISKGGKCMISNLQVLCSSCNKIKSNHYLHPDSYIKRYPIVIDTNEYRINRAVLEKVENPYA